MGGIAETSDYIPSLGFYLDIPLMNVCQWLKPALGFTW